MSINILVFLVPGIVFLLALGVGLVLWVTKRSGQDKDGWLKLVERYGTPQVPSGTVLTKQTLQIGSVLYRDCTTVGIDPEGLYVTTWRKTVVIPWSDFGAVTQGRLFWERVPVLPVGHPSVTTITLPRQLFERLRSFLPPEQQPEA